MHGKKRRILRMVIALKAATKNDFTTPVDAADFINAAIVLRLYVLITILRTLIKRNQRTLIRRRVVKYVRYFNWRIATVRLFNLLSERGIVRKRGVEKLIGTPSRSFTYIREIIYGGMCLNGRKVK